MPHRTAEPSEQGVLVLSAFEAEQFLFLARQSFTHFPAGRAEGEVCRAAGVRVPISSFLGSTRARTVARRLVIVADNAILNGDFQRARAALRDLHEAVAASTDDTDGRDAPAPPVSSHPAAGERDSRTLQRVDRAVTGRDCHLGAKAARVRVYLIAV
jgi:hypothetical protein